MMRLLWRSVGLLALLSAAACAGSGRAQVFVTAEESIPLGIEPGDGADQMVDGWRATYQKFVIAFGGFRAARTSDASARFGTDEVVILDLARLPTDGFVYETFDDVAAVRWDRVGYDLPNAGPTATATAFTSLDDAQRMIDNGWSIYIEATLEKGADRIAIRWGAAAGTSFDECAPVFGPKGFAVPAGGTVQVEPTLHGDHWFFTNLTQDGVEQTERRAQWISDCDLDGDGETTIAELQAVPVSQLFQPPTYNLSGALGPLDTAYDFFVAQARTLGDFQGAGECPVRRILP